MGKKMWSHTELPSMPSNRSPCGCLRNLENTYYIAECAEGKRRVFTEEGSTAWTHDILAVCIRRVASMSVGLQWQF